MVGMSKVSVALFEALDNQHKSSLCRNSQPVRSVYQPPASSTFLSEQNSHQQSANSTFLSQQISTSHQPPAKRTGCQIIRMN
jgi:hypothetical protein